MRLAHATALALLLLTSRASAAPDLTREGRVTLEGAFAFSSLGGEQTVDFDGEEFDSDLPDRTRIQVGAVAGGFVSDRFFLGGRLGVLSESATTEIDDFTLERSATEILIAVVPRYYFPLSESGALYLRVGGHLAYHSQSVSDDDGDIETESSADGFGFQLDAALVIAMGGESGGFVSLGARFAKAFLSGEDDSGGDELDVSQDRTDFGLEAGFGLYF